MATIMGANYTWPGASESTYIPYDHPRRHLHGDTMYLPIWHPEQGLFVCPSGHPLPTYANKEEASRPDNPRYLKDDQVWRAFLPRRVTNTSRLFKRLNFTDLQLERLITHRELGYGTGRHEYLLGEDIQMSWKKLEDALEQLLRFAIKDDDMNMRHFHFNVPQMPATFGYQRTHTSFQYALQCAINSRNAFHEFGAYITFHLSYHMQSQKEDRFDRFFTYMRQKHALLDDDFFAALSESHICHLVPGFRIGCFLDALDCGWGGHITHFVRCHLPIWINFSEKGISNPNHTEIYLYHPPPEVIEFAKQRAQNRVPPPPGIILNETQHDFDADFDMDRMHYADPESNTSQDDPAAVVIRGSGQRPFQTYEQFFAATEQKCAVIRASETKQEKQSRDSKAAHAASGERPQLSRVFGWENDRGFFRRTKELFGKDRDDLWYGSMSRQRKYWREINEFDINLEVDTWPGNPLREKAKKASSAPKSNKGKANSVPKSIKGKAKKTSSTLPKWKPIRWDENDSDAPEYDDDSNSGDDDDQDGPHAAVFWPPSPPGAAGSSRPPQPDVEMPSVAEAGVESVGGEVEDGEVEDGRGRWYTDEERDNDQYVGGYMSEDLVAFLHTRHGFSCGMYDALTSSLWVKKAWQAKDGHVARKLILHAAPAGSSSPYDNSVRNFVNIMQRTPLELRDLPHDWDISPDNSRPLSLRDLRVEKVAISEKSTMYIVSHRLRRSTFSIGTTSATTVLQICRNDPYNVEEIVKELLQHGQSFMTLAPRTRSLLPPPLPAKYYERALGFRPKGFRDQATRADYEVWQRHLKDMACSSFGRAIRLRGGIAARLVRDLVSEDDVLYGPRVGDMLYPGEYVDDAINNNILSVVSGVYYVDTMAKQRDTANYAEVSWWPKQNKWFTQAFGTDYWTPDAEAFFQVWSNKRSNGDFKLYDSAEWAQHMEKHERSRKRIDERTEALAVKYLEKIL